MNACGEPIPPEERDYYLTTFVGRTVVFAVLADEAAHECRSVAAELRDHKAEVVLVESGVGELPFDPDRLVDIWRDLIRDHMSVVFCSDVRAAAEALSIGGRVHKLVLVGPDLVLRDADGGRRSFVDIAASGLPARLMDVAAPLYGGVDGVNLVDPGGVATELLTYSGSGTLLSLGDYGEVRPLGFGDYAGVANLLERGVALGDLRPRSRVEIEAVLPRSFGFFVAGASPAGVVALSTERYEGSGLAELESLFTISRFHGEGVGLRLVKAVEDRAAQLHLDGLFAVTTNDAAATFFETCGYREISQADVPPAKWDAYPPDRLAAVRCFARFF